MDSEVYNFRIKYLSDFVRSVDSRMRLLYDFVHVIGAVVPPGNTTFNASVIVTDRDVRGLNSYDIIDTLAVFDSTELELTTPLNKKERRYYRVNAILNVSLSYCLDVTHMCVVMGPSAVADYIEMVPTNNVMCLEVVDDLYCQPSEFTILERPSDTE